MRSRPVWSTERVLGFSGLHRETLPRKKKKVLNSPTAAGWWPLSWWRGGSGKGQGCAKALGTLIQRSSRGPSRFARGVVAASPRGSSGRAFRETTEEAARASSYRPYLPLHKAAPLSLRAIAAPVRLLPRAGGAYLLLPARLLPVKGRGR